MTGLQVTFKLQPLCTPTTLIYMATHTGQAFFGTLSSADNTSHEACCYHISPPVKEHTLLQNVSTEAPPYRPEVMKTIEDEIDRVTEELRKLNKDLWGTYIVISSWASS